MYYACIAHIQYKPKHAYVPKVLVLLCPMYVLCLPELTKNHLAHIPVDILFPPMLFMKMSVEIQEWAKTIIITLVSVLFSPLYMYMYLQPFEKRSFVTTFCVFMECTRGEISHTMPLSTYNTLFLLQWQLAEAINNYIAIIQFVI